MSHTNWLFPNIVETKGHWRGSRGLLTTTTVYQHKTEDPVPRHPNWWQKASPKHSWSPSVFIRRTIGTFTPTVITSACRGFQAAWKAQRGNREKLLTGHSSSAVSMKNFQTTTVQPAHLKPEPERECFQKQYHVVTTPALKRYLQKSVSRCLFKPTHCTF